MKLIAAAVWVFLAVLTAHFALSAPSPDRPPGVDPRDWIPVSDRMGFVETTHHTFPGAPAVGDQPLLLNPPAQGYFMVRAGKGWQRLIIQDPIKGPCSSG